MFSELKFEPSTKDLFWEEKVKRTIESMDTTKELKEIATLLARIATQRAGVITGLTNALIEAEFPSK
ncbi:MAG: hypothetical protein CL833_07910 [Crocinitomicaceae bacterium]|jgi:stage III sporulation protein SpoIIIAA|nr:hypothetical protein [Crocinitomicaceae bacterium]|tara:strand:+ start:485 stop:685 length:201 start_codon:yes stop_codon:yes gene_type:complete